MIIWDVRKVARYKVFLLMRFAWFVVQVSVFAVLMSYLVAIRPSATSSTSYYEFYLFGAYTALLFSISMFRGYEIAEEFEEGIIEYHLSLPVRRRILAIGRTIGGGIASFTYTLPMMLFIIMMLGIWNPLSILIAMLSALAFSIGIVGLAINIVFGLKSGDRTDILFGVVDALLVRLSTIFYPLPFLSTVPAYFYAAMINPLSSLADFLRALFLFEDLKVFLYLDQGQMISYILGLAVGLSVMAMLFIERRAEGGGWR
ncbi:MAG: ABC transporter [Desulfurococcales archaeon]|jgi:ABC-2 type transport system permease protein|nr:ABC transporter [Desulfurococcales archaeon]